jgi:hypothetical protein
VKGLTTSVNEIRSLIGALSSHDAVERESAVARLAVMGRPATDRLIGAFGATNAVTVKVGVLQALERVADPRALSLACAALDGPADVAVAAAAALKPLLDSRDASVSAAALDALVAAALDSSRERRVRLAAHGALQDIPASMLAKITEAIDTGETKRRKKISYDDAVLDDAADGRLPANPDELRAAVVAKGGIAPLGSLQKVIDAVRAREAQSAERVRTGWQQVRGAAHQALALRDSRIALYDLRETVEAAGGPLPASFLAAMRAVGDASCVEALAAALSRAPADDLWWRHQLASALRAVAKRERMTKRHASMKKVLARWPAAAEVILTGD